MKANLFFLICMIFAHIIDDFYLQGWLASAKQKSWWKQNAPCKLYKYDYIVALFMHSFSWAFMIMLIPTIVTGDWYPAFFVINVLVHMMVDDAKANQKRINLVQDQLVHMAQILVTWQCYFIVH